MQIQIQNDLFIIDTARGIYTISGRGIAYIFIGLVIIGFVIVTIKAIITAYRMAKAIMAGASYSSVIEKEKEDSKKKLQKKKEKRKEIIQEIIHRIFRIKS